MTEQPRALWRRKPGVAILTPIALLASSFVVYQASNAAFTATTTNGVNSWSTGSVVLTDDDAANVMFNVSAMKPGDTGTKCINVSYTGTMAAAVKLYANPVTDSGLGSYLNFTVDEGSGATGGGTLDCTGFTSSSALYTGTLAGFTGASSSYATGASTWAPTGSATKSYRFTYQLQDNNAAQNKSVSATFVWEARNS